MQIPQNARVTNLTMKLSSNKDCIIKSEVKEEEKAQEQFDTSLSEGKPAAILKAWNSTLYPIQVSIPPYGNTVVDIVYEQILHKKKHEIKFQVPLFPGSGVPVKKLLFDVVIEEPYGGVNKFNISQSNLSGMKIYHNDEKTASAHLELTNISGNDDGNESSKLPRMIDVSYDPGYLPEYGILFPDRKKECITHLFNPESLLNTGPMPRNIVFVIDVSGSMQGQKLKDAKSAYVSIINTLTNKDYFTIHTFSGEGVESVWGPQKATSKNKSFATQFVKKLVANGSTNLYDAYIQGISKVNGVQSNTIGNSKENKYVPIMLILTDGRATAGVTSSIEISQAVQKMNTETHVKIFALAFGFDADLRLLRGISLMNNGIAIPIYEGYNDASMQMEDFFIGELGSIRLSDISVSLDVLGGSGDNGNSYSIPTTTKSSFPALSDGSEIVVRARLGDSNIMSNLFSNEEGKIIGNHVIQATTTGRTKKGTRTWINQLDLSNSDNQESNPMTPPSLYNSNECVHSFAIDKIEELLQFRDAVELLGADQLMDYAPFDTTKSDEDLASMAKSEALALALEAGLVWPGLTSMVTIENESCMNEMDHNAPTATDICPNDGVALDQDMNHMHEEDADSVLAFASPVQSQQAYPAVAINKAVKFPKGASSSSSNAAGMAITPASSPKMAVITKLSPISAPVNSPVSSMAPTQQQQLSSNAFLNETLNETTRFLSFLNDMEEEEEEQYLLSFNENQNDKELQDSTTEALVYSEKITKKNIRAKIGIKDGIATKETVKSFYTIFVTIASCSWFATVTFCAVLKLLYNKK